MKDQAEIMAKNFDTWLDLLVSTKRVKKELIEERTEQIMFAPASTRVEYARCSPGGLVRHSLEVYKIMKELSKFTNDDMNSVIITSLLHDIGKIGSRKFDYYVEEQSEWHQKMGQLYRVNPKIAWMPVNQRSIVTINEFGVILTEEEIYSILSVRSDQNNKDVSTPSSVKEPTLAALLQCGVRLACSLGNNITETSLFVHL